ncbi:hypothetical protein HBB16_00540 [Pseudonocardia sp. MCCB 268]|nr:hypothetical protein [Pseudonocardia cytotoxica]
MIEGERDVDVDGGAGRPRWPAAASSPSPRRPTRRTTARSRRSACEVEGPPGPGRRRAPAA